MAHFLRNFHALVMGTLLATLTGCMTSCNESAAEGAMKEYVKKTYPNHTYVGGACTGGDSDGDGYVSCTANLKNSQGIEEEKYLECVKAFEVSLSGCKKSKTDTRPN